MHRHALTFELHAAKLNLGCFQRYRKSTRHGNLATRLKEGAKRAHCIAALPFDTKARLQAILAGPLQVALYGSEISYIGEKSVKGLRSATSKVLACSNHGTNHKVAILSMEGSVTRRFRLRSVLSGQRDAPIGNFRSSIPLSFLSCVPTTVIVARLGDRQAR